LLIDTLDFHVLLLKSTERRDAQKRIYRFVRRKPTEQSLTPAHLGDAAAGAGWAEIEGLNLEMKEAF
jgi:hypothetical protein